MIETEEALEPLQEDMFSVVVPTIKISDDELVIITASSSNYYTSSFNQSDTCCTCTS